MDSYQANIIRRMLASAQILAYFEDTWMIKFRPRLWNHFENEGDRTNNAVEGWRSRVNRKHPNIFQLIKLLQREDAVTKVKISQLAHGAQPVKRKRCWDLKNSRIIGLKQRFSENGQIHWIIRIDACAKKTLFN